MLATKTQVGCLKKRNVREDLKKPHGDCGCSCFFNYRHNMIFFIQKFFQSSVKIFINQIEIGKVFRQKLKFQRIEKSTPFHEEDSGFVAS
jgi:hypothetical protein